MIKDFHIDFSYVEEVFGSEQDCYQFLMLMHAEFSAASYSFSEAILKQDVYAMRKIMHNVVAHLEMLKAQQLIVLLQRIKNQLAEPLPENTKQELIEEVRLNFESLLQLIQQRAPQFSREG